MLSIVYCNFIEMLKCNLQNFKIKTQLVLKLWQKFYLIKKKTENLLVWFNRNSLHANGTSRLTEFFRFIKKKRKKLKYKGRWTGWKQVVCRLKTFSSIMCTQKLNIILMFAFWSVHFLTLFPPPSFTLSLFSTV